MNLAVERQYQGHRVLGDRSRRIGGYPYHGQAETGGSFEIHVIEPGAAQRNQLRARFGQAQQGRCAQIVVDEGAYDVEVVGECCGGSGQPSLEELEFVICLFGGGSEESDVVGLGAENGDAHNGECTELETWVDACRRDISN